MEEVKSPVCWMRKPVREGDKTPAKAKKKEWKACEEPTEWGKRSAARELIKGLEIKANPRPSETKIRSFSVPGRRARRKKQSDDRIIPVPIRREREMRSEWVLFQIRSESQLELKRQREPTV